MPQVPPPEALVVAYCHHGVRSLSAAAILLRAGHARVMERFTWAAVAKRCLSEYRREDD